MLAIDRNAGPLDGAVVIVPFVDVAIAVVIDAVAAKLSLSVL